MAGINSFDISKYDIGGTQQGDKAGDKKLTGDEVRKARAEGWTVWDGFMEGDKVEYVEPTKDLKSKVTSYIKTRFNMQESASYKKFAERKEAIIEEKLAAKGIYKQDFEDGKAWGIGVENSDEYIQAAKEADAQARKELGLSENTFEIGGKTDESKKDNTVAQKISEIARVLPNLKYSAEVDKIFSQILKDKYSIDTAGKTPDELKKLREQYKDDFETAKAQAKEKLGKQDVEYVERKPVEPTEPGTSEVEAPATPATPKDNTPKTSGVKKSAGTKKAGSTKKTTGGNNTSNTYEKTACPTIFKKGDKYYRKLNNGKYKEIIAYATDSQKKAGITSYKITKVNKDGSFVAISNKNKNGLVCKRYFDKNGNLIKSVAYQNGKIHAAMDGYNSDSYYKRITYYDENGKPIETEYYKKGDSEETVEKVRDHKRGKWVSP